MASEAPPTYADATEGQGAPPTYDSLFGVGEMREQMKDAKQHSTNKGIFAVKFCEIMCNSICLMLCLMVIATIPIAMIIIGAIYLDDCELEENIPIFLLVFGCVSLFHTIINILKRLFCTKKKESDEEAPPVQSRLNRGTSSLEGVLLVFLFVWFIIGSVWVFGNYDEWKDDKHRCDSVVYLFAFVLLIIKYTFLAFLCCCCCCMFCCIGLGSAGE